MPSARIDLRTRLSPEARQNLAEALHQAMREALKIPERDRLIRVVEHDPGDFLVPPGASERYALVEISLFPGRSLEAKRALYRGVVERFGALGIPAADVRVVLHEVPRENWGIRGGLPASDVDLGFKVDV